MDLLLCWLRDRGLLATLADLFCLGGQAAATFIGASGKDSTPLFRSAASARLASKPYCCGTTPALSCCLMVVDDNPKSVSWLQVPLKVKGLKAISTSSPRVRLTVMVFGVLENPLRSDPCKCTTVVEEEA
eukprot:1997539-Amphidinium_carterae.3